MNAVRLQEAAAFRLDEIYCYTRDKWGQEQAERYITGLFDSFDKVDIGGVMSYPIPAEFGVNGFYFRYEKHFVYWRRLSNGDIGIVSVLHERMHQFDRFQDDF